MPRNTSSPPRGDKRVFTTGEAAEICGVSQQTIIRSFDKGLLNGYRIPGSRARRIPAANLLEYMKSNRIPREVEVEDAQKRVLVALQSVTATTSVQRALESDIRFEVRCALDGYDAGVFTEKFKPHLILIDTLGMRLGRVVHQARENPRLPDTRVVVVADDPTVDPDHGVDAYIPTPVSLRGLMSIICKLLEA